MNASEPFNILGPSAQYDTCGPKDFGNTTDIPGVYHAKLPNGRSCRLFKVLQTNACRNNCAYCVNRQDNDIPRAVISPEKMAVNFMNLVYRRLVEGLFLSSGIAGSSEATMTRMIETAQLVRLKYRYRGYVHLKIMPGVSDSLIEESAKLADRISINLEIPAAKYAKDLVPEKDFYKDLWGTLERIRGITYSHPELVSGSEFSRPRSARFRNKFGMTKSHGPSITTQFVVGAAGESDKEIINTTNRLYKEFGLKRVFYSAFRPARGTPLEEKPAASLMREHRLYQTDWLLRFYGFKVSEIPLDEKGSLFENKDPKESWAQSHPEFFPVDIRKADYQTLLRVPGIGPTIAERLLQNHNYPIPRKTVQYITDQRQLRLL